MDINALMRQAQQMQKTMQKKQEELENTVFTNEVGGGAVSISLYGSYKVKEVKINKEVMDFSDPEAADMLSEMIEACLEGVIARIQKAQEDITDSMKSSLGGGRF